MSLCLRTNSKISPCKNRQNKIESDKFKVYHWQECKIFCLLFWRQNVTYATVGCEIVRYYPNNIQMEYIIEGKCFMGKTEGHKILGGIRRKLKNNVRLGFK
jgi:hypothetical protein